MDRIARGYWDPEVSADENSIPDYRVTNGKGYYNWYAATAGSGTSSMVSVAAEDSVCASGWSLPSKDDFINLFSVAYKLARESADSVHAITRLPMSWDFTTLAYGVAGQSWPSSSANPADRAHNIIYDYRPLLSWNDRTSKSTRLTVRCLQRDAE